MLYRDGGQPELAEARLQTAERTVGLARVNGIDNARIYYSAACLSAMRGEVTRSLQTLQQAYEKGFRMSWLLDRDGRLDALRDTPEFEAIRQRINEDLAQAREAVARL